MASEWIDCKLADACASIDYGLTAAAADAEVGPKFLRITDIVSGHIDWKTVPCVVVNNQTIEKYRLYNDDIVLARTGASTGASIYVKSPPLAVFASYLVRLKTKSEYDARFIAYYLKSDMFWSFIRAVLGDKSAQPNASASTMTQAPLHAPKSKIEQRAIAHILGTLDDKIELNRKMNETLEAMAQALFKSWFVDFDPVRAKAEGRPTDLPKHITDLFPDSFEDSELGEIPKGWEVGTLGMLGELVIGGDWGEDSTFAGSIEASCLRGVDLEHLRLLGHSSAPRRWVKPISLERRAMDDRDVLVAGSGAGPTGRSLWMCEYLLQTLGSCVYSNFCKRIRCGCAAEAVYFDTWLHEMRESGEIWEHVNGTSVPNLDANSLLSGKEIPLPPMSVLDKYHDFVLPIRQKLYDGQNHTLSALRDMLLPKLISGELRLKDVDRFLMEM